MRSATTRGDVSETTPLTADDATMLARRIAVCGTISWTAGALRRLSAERLTTIDCHNAIRRGTSDPGERSRSLWRYRIHTPAVRVEVVFRSNDELVVVSAARRRG
jgi:hypothetical protein